jgi:uncharacterized protein YegL
LPGTDDLAANPEPRLPSILLLDVSHSMAGEPITELAEGVRAYQQDLLADDLARQRVEVAVITFGKEVRTLCPFTTVQNFNPPLLKPAGQTPMGAAINHALDLLASRKQAYRAHGLSYFLPWVFLITDGAPTDEWESAAERVRREESARGFRFFAIAVKRANLNTLRAISPRPWRLQGLNFRELFVWLSRSQRSISRSSPNLEDRVALIDPTAAGWACLESRQTK